MDLSNLLRYVEISESILALDPSLGPVLRSCNKQLPQFADPRLNQLAAHDFFEWQIQVVTEEFIQQDLSRWIEDLYRRIPDDYGWFR